MKITHLEGHRTEDLARVFNRVVEAEPKIYPTPTEIRLHEAELASRTRELWLMGFLITAFVIGATIAVIVTTLAMQFVF